MHEIYVDADACPVKDEVLKVAGRHKWQIHMVSNSWMRLADSSLINRVVVPEGDHRLVYEALAEMDEGVVLELPIRTQNDGAVWPFVEAMRMYHATIDFNPRINGYSGSAPRGFDALGDILNGYPSKEAGESIDGLGVRYVILHTGTEQGIQAYTVAEAEAIAAVAADLGGTISRHGNDWLVDRGENV